ncbi:MAG: hypothetical protein KGR26_08395, partial [Cyanobacteria bacterium REEB65]|nr:hypothetical protein [Cyanobacteria bacterium REEB65]
IAGNGTFGYGANGQLATLSALRNPEGLAVDSVGNVYIADTQNNSIRMVAASSGQTVFGVSSTTVGDIYTIAGSPTGIAGYTDGAGVSSEFYNPVAVALDAAGYLYVADENNDVIREISSIDGSVSTFAGKSGAWSFGGDGGPATSASFYGPMGVALDSNGNVFVADQGNDRVRVIAAASGVTIDGAGPTTAGDIYTVLGNGTAASYPGPNIPGSSTAVTRPSGLAIDPANGQLYTLVAGDDLILSLSANGLQSVVAGNGSYANLGDGGPAAMALLSNPTAIALDPAGTLYIADNGHNLVREVAPTGQMTTIAGNATNNLVGGCCTNLGGLPTANTVSNPTAITLDSTGDLLIATSGSNDSYALMIPRTSGTYYGVSISAGSIGIVAGMGQSGSTTYGSLANQQDLNNPGGLAVDSLGDLFISDTSNAVIRKVTPSGAISVVAGNSGTFGFGGDGTPANSAGVKLYYPWGIAIDTLGNLYIADFSSHVVRMVPVMNGIYYGVSMTAGDIYTIAGTPSTAGYSGDGGPATLATLDGPKSVTLDPAGNLYIADAFNNVVRRVDTSGIITTVAGSAYTLVSLAGNQRFAQPTGIALSALGTSLFVADSGDGEIWRVQ